MESWQETAEALHAHANELFRDGDFQDAHEAFRRAHRLYAGRRGKEHELARCRWGMGSCCIELGRFQEALDSFRYVLPEFLRVGDDERHAQASLEAADLLRLLCVDIRAQGVVGCLCEEPPSGGAVEIISHRLQDALRTCRTGLERADARNVLLQVGFKAALGRTLFTLYGVAGGMPLVEEGAESFEQAVALLEGQPEHWPQELSIRADYAHALFGVRKFNLALEQFNQIFLRLDPEEDREEVIGVLNEIGRCLLQDQPSTAVRAYEAALALIPGTFGTPAQEQVTRSMLYAGLAESYSRMRVNGRALRYYRLAIQVLEDEGPEAMELRAVYGTNLGRGLMFLGRYREAIEVFRAALSEQHKRGATGMEMSPYHANIGSALLQLGDPEGALVHLRRSLELGKGYPDLLTQSLLVDALADAGRPREAIEASRMFPGYFQAHDLRWMVGAYRKIGDLHSKVGDHRAAEEHYRTSLTLALEQEEIATSEARRVSQFCRTMRSSEAYLAYDGALATFELASDMHGDQRVAIEKLVGLGAKGIDPDSLGTAREVRSRDLDAARVDCLVRSGVAAAEAGLHSDALRRFELALEESSASTPEGTMALLYLHLGQVRLYLNQDGAVAALEAALEPARNAGDVALIAYAHLILGQVKVGDRPKEAEAHLREAEAFFEKSGGSSRSSGVCRMLLAAALFKSGERVAAEREVSAALELSREAGYPDLQATVHALLADVASRPEEANEHLKAAMVALSGVDGFDSERARIQLASARVALQLGNVPAATEATADFLESEWTYLEQVLPALTGEEKRRVLEDLDRGARLLQALSFLDVAPPNGSELGLFAALVHKSAIAEAVRHDQSSYHADQSEWIQGMGGRIVTARTQLAGLVLKKVRYPALALTGEADSEVQLREEIESSERARRRHPVSFKWDRMQLIDVSSVAAVLEPGEVLLEYVVYVDPRSKREGERYGVYVLEGATGSVAAVDLGPKGGDTGLDLLLLGCSERMSNAERGHPTNSPANVGKLSAEVRKRVLDRALASTEAPVRRLYVAPAGRLDLVPFQALPLETEDGSPLYLLEELECVYIASGRDLARFAEPSPQAEPGPALIVGNPSWTASAEARAGSQAGLSDEQLRTIPRFAAATTDSPCEDLGEIPEVEDYLKELTRLLSSLGVAYEEKTGIRATEEAVFATRSPRILELVTHGCLLEESSGPVPVDPMFANVLVLAGGASRAPDSHFLVSKKEGRVVPDAGQEELISDPDWIEVEIGDGLLTPFEVSCLDLRGTELVGLTACETGLTTAAGSDGIHGLWQSFFVAGARSILLSKWSVPAHDSLALTSRFHGLWLGEGKTRYDAWHQAQLDALEASRARESFEMPGHPYWWAGFVFTGDPGDLDR